MAAAVQTLSLEQLATWADTTGRRLAHPDFTPVLKACVQILVSSTKQNFDAGQSPDGVPWAHLLHPSKKRGGASARPLRDNDILMASLGGAGANNVTDLSPTALVWGTSVTYASFHQHGTQHMVARPFLGINDAMAGDIAALFGEWTERQVQ